MTIRAKFAGKCAVCGHSIRVDQPILWTRGLPATHVTRADCAAAAAFDAAQDQARAAAAAAVGTVDLKPVADFLGRAKASLKYPEARFLSADNRELRLNVAGEKSRYPGAIQVKLDDTWIGRVCVSGKVEGPLVNRPEIVARLRAIVADPEAAAKEYGTLTGRCFRCNKRLEDEGSVEVGYGPVCAKHFGLPHKYAGRSKAIAIDTERNPVEIEQPDAAVECAVA